MKKETLEDAARECAAFHTDGLNELFIEIFKEGAKWQLEQFNLKQ